jgi:hypothetical protein
MRFVFQGMLGISMGITAAGMTLGLQARDAADPSLSSSSHTSATRHSTHGRMDLLEAIAPPLPIAPRFGSEVAAAPRLAWRLTDGTDGARVELCPSSDFDERTRLIDVTGSELRLPPSWPPGVWYWRLRGKHGADTGDRATPTWMLYVMDGSSSS